MKTKSKFFDPKGNWATKVNHVTGYPISKDRNDSFALLPTLKLNNERL